MITDSCFRRFVYAALTPLLVLAACVDNPVSPVSPSNEVSAGPEILTPSAGPSFNQGPNLLANCTVVANIAVLPTPIPICAVERNQTQTKVRITFEGVGSYSSPGTLGYATFPAWHGLIAARVGPGYDGNTYNEPSGVTTLFWSRISGAANPNPTSRDILFARPVHTALLYYSARTSCPGFRCTGPPRLPGITLKGLGSTGATLDTIFAPENFNQGSTPNPNWTYNKWDPIQVVSPLAGVIDNRIHKLNINGYEDLIGIDDVILTIINFRPVAVAAASYSGVQGTPIAFDGSVSYDPVDAAGLPHPSGDAVTYFWEFIDGVTGEVIGTSTQAQTSATFFREGTHTAKLRVTDPNLLSDSLMIPVTVSNVAPNVVVRDTTVNVGQSLVLPVQFTDPGLLDSPWSYTINWGDGRIESGNVTSSDPKTPSGAMTLPAAHRTHTYSTRGPHTVTVTVTDAPGLATTRVVTVHTPNRAPIAMISGAPTSGLEGSTLHFGSTGTVDPDGDPLTLTWTVANNATPGNVTTIQGTTLNHVFPDNGSYTVTLTVSDGSLSATAQHSLTISNVAPTATFVAPPGGVAGQAFSISLTSPYDPSPADVAAGFQYAFNCGTGFMPYGPSSTASCTPAVAGALTVGGRIRDKDGGFTEYTAPVDVVVPNSPPTARITGPASGTEGSTLSFSGATSSDPDEGQTLTYTWTIAENSSPAVVTTLSGAVVNFLFPDNGTYTATLTVRDNGPNGGLSDVAVHTVTISNIAPTAILLAPSAGTVGQAFSISLTSPYDPSTVDVAAGFQYAFNCGTGFMPYGSSSTASCTPAVAGTLTVGGRIRDKDGGFTEYTASVDVVVPNSPPTARITGPASGTEGSTLSFSGATSSDPDEGQTLTYTWTIAENSSPAVVTTLSGAVVNFLFPDNGTYTVRLTVRDNGPNGGLSDVAAHTVTISNVAPTATFVAPPSGVTGQAFSISLTSPYDPSTVDVAAGFQYAFNCGTGFMPYGSSSTASCTPAVAGTLTVGGRIRDKDGGFTEYTAPVNVVVPNSPPTARITGPASGTEGSTLSFSGATSSDPDEGQTLTYTWTIAENSSPAVVTTLSGAVVNFLFPDNGTYTVRLTVRDNGPNGGLSDVAVHTVAISNVAPTATFNAPATVLSGEAFTITMTDPTDPSPIDLAAGLTYSFNCGNGFSTWKPVATATCTVTATGPVTVSGRVRDKDGGQTTYSHTVQVRGEPTAVIGAATGAQGSAVQLSSTGSQSNPAGGALTYAWSTDEGHSSTAASPSFTFIGMGNRTVTLTVTDEFGLSSSTSRTIAISNVAPTVTASNVSGVVGKPVTLPISFSDPGTNDGPWTVKVLWGSGQISTASRTNQNAFSLSNTFSQPGVYHAVIAVVDKHGGGGSRQITVNVAGPPSAVIGGAGPATQGTPIQLNATGSQPYTSGGTLSYVWTSGSTTLTGPSASFTFQTVGSHTVQLKVTEAQTGLTAFATVTIAVTAPQPQAGALILREITFNGSSRVQGSVQVMQNSNVTFNGNATVTGDLLMAGMPTVVRNGNPNFAGTVDGSGSATPTGHRVTLNGGITLGRVVRRTNPVALPTVAAPPSPTGNRSVALNKVGDSPGSFSTIRDLTLNGNMGAVPVPAGTYGNFTANGNGSFVLGVAGATTPSVYNFQSINLNGSSSIRVVGPVIVTVRNSVAFNGAVGTAGRPEWLTLRIATGGLTLNSSVSFDGYLEAPNGPVVLNSNTRLTGGLAAQSLTLNGNGQLILVPRP